MSIPADDSVATFIWFYCLLSTEKIRVSTVGRFLSADRYSVCVTGRNLSERCARTERQVRAHSLSENCLCCCYNQL